MTARVQCAAVTLWHGQRVRCIDQTALRLNVVERDGNGNRMFLPDGRVDLVRPAVCSRHTAWIESNGIAFIDHEAVPA